MVGCTAGRQLKHLSYACQKTSQKESEQDQADWRWPVKDDLVIEQVTTDSQAGLDLFSCAAACRKVWL